MTQDPRPFERRSFLTRLNTGLASLAAMAGVAMAQQKSSAAAHWEPARHEKDDWLEKQPAKHRLVFDTTSPEGVGEALAFANNYFRTNRVDYGLENSDLAVVVVLRHRATALGYNDAMWAKYGAPLAERSKAEDPKTRSAPKINIYNGTEYGELTPNRGVTLESLSQLGAQFALCSTSTHAFAAAIAKATGANPDAVFTELTHNLVSNGRMVPAGIVAVNRAQERGYSLVTS